jgi:tyrosyl-tRNA synthetase
VTGWLPERVEETLDDLGAGRLKPVEAKRLLARTIVDLYHGDGAGAAAEAEFDRVFKDRSVPTDVPEVEIPAAELPLRVDQLLARLGLVPSNKEGRRMVEQGAVKLDGEPLTDADASFEAAAVEGRTVNVGKRRWARVKVV